MRDTFLHCLKIHFLAISTQTHFSFALLESGGFWKWTHFSLKRFLHGGAITEAHVCVLIGSYPSLIRRTPVQWPFSSRKNSLILDYQWCMHYGYRLIYADFVVFLLADIVQFNFCSMQQLPICTGGELLFERSATRQRTAEYVDNLLLPSVFTHVSMDMDHFWYGTKEIQTPPGYFLVEL